MSKSIQLKDKNNNKYYPHPYYPIGSIYLSINNTNPSTWFGGTWSLIAQGRTLVGVDTNDTDFNTVQKTGGNKSHTHTTGDHTLTVNEMPAHNHGVFSNTDYRQSSGVGYWGWDLIEGYCYGNEKNVNNGGGTRNAGGGQAHNHGDTGSTSNLPPYFTCYIWCRTA